VLTIDMQGTDSSTPAAKTQESVLVIGRSEKVIREAVDLLRQSGRVAGATNDFDNVPDLFDPAALDIVVFGGMVPPARKEELRQELSAANPAIAFLQGLAGIPGLIVEQVEGVGGPWHLGPEAVDYRSEDRTLTVSLAAAQPVRVTAYWHTAFVPPDPESTSQVILDEALGAGVHTVPVPDFVPTSASFLAVHVGEDVHVITVGPMPRGTTRATDIATI
jgi:hypothetical protein